MKNDRFERALNFLDDDLISEAADYVPPHKAKPVRIFKNAFKYSAAAACLLAVIVGAFALKPAVLPDPDKIASLEDPENSSDIISSVLSSYASPANPGVSVSTDSSPISSDFFNPTISDWFDDPDVVWYSGQALKEGIKTYPKELGTSEITDKLKILMNENPDAVFAVKVSFALYESDRDTWEYNGTTIAEMQELIDEMLFKSNDPSGTVEDLKLKLMLALYDYYMDKCQEFLETFNANDLGFYCITRPESAKMKDYNYFICFATAEQIKNFTCKPTEAFVFDTISKDSARDIF